MVTAGLTAEQLRDQPEKTAALLSEKIEEQGKQLEAQIKEQLEQSTARLTESIEKQKNAKETGALSGTEQRTSYFMDDMFDVPMNPQIDAHRKEWESQVTGGFEKNRELLLETGQKIEEQTAILSSKLERSEESSRQILEKLEKQEEGWAARLNDQQADGADRAESLREYEQLLGQKFEELKDMVQNLSAASGAGKEGGEERQAEKQADSAYVMTEARQTEFLQKFAAIQNLIIDSVRREDSIFQQIASEMNGKINDIVIRLDEISKIDRNFINKVHTILEEGAKTDTASPKEIQNGFAEVNSVTIEAGPSGEPTVVEKEHTSGALSEQSSAEPAKEAPNNREILDKLEEVKGDIEEKIHGEMVRCYRNIRSLIEENESDSSKTIRQDEPVHVAPESIRGYLRFILWLTLLNTVLFILNIIGIL